MGLEWKGASADEMMMRGGWWWWWWMVGEGDAGLRADRRIFLCAEALGRDVRERY